MHITKNELLYNMYMTLLLFHCSTMPCNHFNEKPCKGQNEECSLQHCNNQFGSPGKAGCCNVWACGSGHCQYRNRCSNGECKTNATRYDHQSYFEGGRGPVCMSCGKCLHCCSGDPTTPLLQNATCWACDTCKGADAKLPEVCQFCNMCTTCHIQGAKCVMKADDLKQCPIETCTNPQWADDLCYSCWGNTGQHAHTAPIA